MIWLLAGLILFLGIHAFSMARASRESAIALLGGEGPFKGVYALVAAIGFGLIIYGYGQYRADGYIPLWNPPAFGRHVAMLFMLFAFILLAATYIPSHIRARTKHPMITAVILWSGAHLLVRGDLGSVLLFGGFLAWGITGRISMAGRTKSIFSAPTLGAPHGFGNDLIVIGLGLVLYVAMLLFLHPLLIGVPIIRP